MVKKQDLLNLNTARENQGYYSGSHWDTWIGPRIPESEPKAAELMREVERVFQSVNFVRECCDRHVSALIGKFPMWYLKGTDGNRISTKDEDGNPLSIPAAQAELELQRWIDAVLQRSDSGVTDQGDPFLKAVTDLVVTGYGAFRLWQPARFENADPIGRTHLHSPAVGSVKEERGEDGFLDKLTYSYGDNQKEILELDGSTLVVTGTEIEGELRIETGDRWTISQMRSPSLLTPQIKKNQDAVNHALTMLLRNQEQAGFLEKIFMNAQPPGEWVDDTSAPGGQRFVPSSEGIETGPGRNTFLYGIPTQTANGETYTNPTVTIRDPVQVQTFLESIQAFRAFIYHQFGQGHLLQEGDGSISGISRIQLRQDFETTLTRQKRVIEAAIANILNVVLRILGYEDFEVVVQLRISTGKLSPEEQTAVISKFDKGLLSKATAMAILGDVEDVDAELALISEETTIQTQRRTPLSDPLTVPPEEGGES